MFFMVLELRLTKVGTQRSPFFFAFLSETASDSVPFFTSLHKKNIENGDAGKIKDEKQPHSSFFVVSLQVIALITTASVPDEQGIRTRYQAACAMLKTLTNNI